MEVKKKVVESAASELTKQIILLLLPLLSGLVVALVPQVRDRILPGLTKPLLAVLAGISLSLNLALVFYVFRLRKSLNLSRKLTPRFGVLWSQDQVAHCPACSKPLGHYGEYAVGNWKRMGFKCVSCRHVLLMSDDDGRIIELTEAKKLLTANGRDSQSEKAKELSDSLDETSVKLLRFIANSSHKSEEPALIRHVGLHPERVRHHLDTLEEGKYIYAIRVSLGYNSPTTYHLAQRGREYLLQHNLI